MEQVTKIDEALPREAVLCGGAAAFLYGAQRFAMSVEFRLGWRERLALSSAAFAEGG